jgi:aquaporin Z
VRRHGYAEWLAELAGTALLLGVGFSVVAVVVSPLSPVARAIPGEGLRFLVVGVTFGLLAASIAISPLGRRSGAHLNPAITLGFWLRRDVHPNDLAGYVVAQALGAILGTVAFSLALGSWAASIATAATRPDDALGDLGGLAVEAGLTCALLVAIFSVLTVERLVRWTPAVVVAALTLLIWAGSPLTGASMNPARSLAPAILENDFSALWIYVVGPALGAAAAVALVRRRTLTMKLCRA